MKYRSLWAAALILVLNLQNAGAANSTAEETLDKLAVKGRAPKTGFARSQFGPVWSDVNRNGCDTRNDILKREIKRDLIRLKKK